MGMLETKVKFADEPACPFCGEQALNIESAENLQRTPQSGGPLKSANNTLANLLDRKSIATGVKNTSFKNKALHLLFGSSKTRFVR